MTTLNWPVESTAYYGPITGLVPIPMRKGSSISEVTDSGWTSRTTVTGRVRAQRRRHTRRRWSVSLESLPSESLTALRSLAGQDSWPADPMGQGMAWITPYAQSTNLMSHERAALMRVIGVSSFETTGPGVMPDGTFVSGTAMYTAIGSIPLGFQKAPVAFQPTPVIPGVPVTGSAWLVGETTSTPTQLYFTWFKSDGSTVEHPYGSFAKVSPTWTRHVLTVTPPSYAVAVRVQAGGAVRIAGSQVTWTPGIMPYSPGMGAHAVALMDPTTEWDGYDATDSWAKVNFDVLEIG